MKKYTKYFILSFFVVLGIVLIIMGSSYSLFNYQVKGKTKNKITTGIYNSCEYENGTEWTFDYTGSEQTFTVPCDGEYKVELWGAQGGNMNYSGLTGFGGKGSYTSGNIKLNKTTKIYVYVGENINGYGSTNSYNGGGRGSYGTVEDDYNANGGGATDIRLVPGSWDNFQSLKSRIMVAAGGGGGIYYYNGVAAGGYGGSLSGGNGNGYSPRGASGELAKGATQTGVIQVKSTLPGRFGLGGTSIDTNATHSDYFYFSGGGGGYYGGSSGGATAGGFVSSAGGGSSFISGYIGCDAIEETSTEINIKHTGQANHYSGFIFTDSNMIAGNNSMPTHDGTGTMTGNTGNGYAKITLVKSYERYKESILNGTDPVLEGSLVPVQISDNGTVTKADTAKKWYSYANKEWANAVILKDESVTYQNGETIPDSNIESYFVWIPRYKYKIFDEGNYTGLTSIESKEQVIEVVFENKDTTPSNGTTVGDYLTHPAFTSFNSNGMWVGKFETGYDGATTTTEAQVNSVATDKIIIKPNVYSWRSITIGNMFKNSYDYQRSLDSHMMKNTEWGAVAYLQHSEYGSATSVRINNNRAYITGYSATVEPTLGYNGGNSFEGNRNESTSIGIDGTYTVNYLNSNSTVSSTTGNYTGIYDMSGGAWEDVMCYTTGASTVGGSSGITDLYANFFSDTNYTKYWDKYTSTSNTNYNNRILGDATGEIGPFGSEVDPDNVGRYKASWYRVYADFMNVSSPWLDRGGGWHQGTGSGNFAFSDSTGGVYTYDGYRIVLTPQ